MPNSYVVTDTDGDNRREFDTQFVHGMGCGEWATDAGDAAQEVTDG